MARLAPCLRWRGRVERVEDVSWFTYLPPIILVL